MGHSLFYLSRLQLSLLKTKPNLQVKLLLFSLSFFGENGRGWSFPCHLLLFLILEICLQLCLTEIYYGRLINQNQKIKLSHWSTGQDTHLWLAGKIQTDFWAVLSAGPWHVWLLQKVKNPFLKPLFINLYSVCNISQNSNCFLHWLDWIDITSCAWVHF